MPTADLKDMRIAILVAEGFEQVELTEPRKALDDAGARTSIVSPATDQVQGWNHFDKGDNFRVDVPLTSARADEFDALLLPGGVANPDQLRANTMAVEFVRAFFDASKPVAAICHGPWTLIEAGVARGRKMTSWPSLKTDLVNAGVEWVDEEVVCEQGLVTSRKPKDLPAFNSKMLELFAQSRRLGDARKAGRSALEASTSPGAL